MAWASCSDSATTASRNVRPSALSSAVIGAWPACPVATSTNESLVEVSPSMVMRLKLKSAASCTSACNAGRETTASVATKPSIVAMFGRIMPAPLAMPVTVTLRPPMTTRRDAALATVSVVMMPLAASAQPLGVSAASAAGRPASMRSTGSVSMITPVENGSTCVARTPINVPSASQLRRARAMPSAPVPALALPVLMRIARTASAPDARCSRHSCTGAAQKRFLVNTPATMLPAASSKTTRSRRLALRTPAIAVPMRTPGTGNRAAGSGAFRFTGMVLSAMKPNILEAATTTKGAARRLRP